MKFFLDETFAPRFARMLAIYYENDPKHPGYDVIPHKDRFDPGTPDEVWMAELAKEDPACVVVSGDFRIVKDEATRIALRDSNLTFFAFRGKSFQRLPFEDQVGKLIQIWHRIVKHARTKTPTVFAIPLQALTIEDLGPTRSIMSAQVQKKQQETKRKGKGKRR